jgi:hypothetical protein
MRTLLIVVFCFVTSTAHAQGLLENPAPDSFQSGLGLISGWHCTAQRIDIEIDDKIRTFAARGTPRSDTRDQCGDTNNGFGLLINWNDLRDGPHVINVLADGQPFARATFSVTTLGTDFLRGKRATCRVSQFPDSRTDTILAWQESLQNFTITDTVPNQGGSFPSMPESLQNFTITDTVPNQGGSFPSMNGQWHGVVEPNIAVAKGNVSCDGATISLTITSPTFSGSVETEAGIQLTFSGIASNEGVMAGTAWRNGEYFAMFAGSISGNRITGRWNDVSGCWGDFELEPD